MSLQQQYTMFPKPQILLTTPYRLPEHHHKCLTINIIINYYFSIYRQLKHDHIHLTIIVPRGGVPNQNPYSLQHTGCLNTTTNVSLSTVKCGCVPKLVPVHPIPYKGTPSQSCPKPSALFTTQATTTPSPSSIQSAYVSNHTLC